MAKHSTNGKTRISARHDLIGSLRHDVDDLFGHFGRGFLAWSRFQPRLEVSETDSEIEIDVELPGLEENDVEVSLCDDVLTICGDRRTGARKKGENYALSERTYEGFIRRVALPAGVDPKTVQAQMSKGVLTVRAPKPPPAAGSKIEVRTAA